VILNIVWGAGEGLHAYAGISGFKVLVVAMIFCKGFLKNRDPESGVGADACENGTGATVPLINEGKRVVNDHGVRYSEGVKIDTVDAGLVKFASGVHEKFFDAARHLGQGSG
jgi:hypothetical protein